MHAGLCFRVFFDQKMGHTGRWLGLREVSRAAASEPAVAALFIGHGHVLLVQAGRQGDPRHALAVCRRGQSPRNPPTRCCLWPLSILCMYVMYINNSGRLVRSQTSDFANILDLEMRVPMN